MFRYARFAGLLDYLVMSMFIFLSSLKLSKPVTLHYDSTYLKFTITYIKLKLILIQ